MRVLVFGASGMVGEGVLRECLLDERVSEVLVVGRSPLGRQAHAKLREIVRPDLSDLAPVEDQLTGYDAAFYCVGTSFLQQDEQAYRVITLDLTLAVARTLARLNPAMTFIYVSGAGAAEQGRMIWARVKGETENALRQLPFDAVMFRPGYIQPRHGIRSRNRPLRIMYTAFSPVYPLLKRVLPKLVTNTELLGRAMVDVAANGTQTPILETADINAVATALKTS
jgi:uncharacterized protein YbjT (DUF2867 family)